jgi:ABC-2 type transport system ATP-binding protein
MKDVEALCQRVVIIAQGRIMFDGSLAGIVDRFSSHKVVSLQFPAHAEPPGDLAHYGEVVEQQFPKVKLRVDRRAVAEVLANILAEQSIEDVSVEDPPLEEVIAEMFSLAGEQIAREEQHVALARVEEP